MEHVLHVGVEKHIDNVIHYGGEFLQTLALAVQSSLLSTLIFEPNDVVEVLRKRFVQGSFLKSLLPRCVLYAVGIGKFA